MNAGVEVQSTCTVRVTGGLGNQLFQYAAGRALAMRLDCRLMLDVSFYRKGRHRVFALSQFPIKADVGHMKGASFGLSRWSSLIRGVFGNEKTYREPHFHFDPNFDSLTPPVVLEGYFQSYRYCQGWEQQIRTDLEVPMPTDSESLRLADQIANVEATVLHIRRGDYISSPKASRIYAPCTLEYYKRAMEQIPGKDPVLVLSDDMDWARRNVPAVKPLLFPVANAIRPAMADLWLMTKACHHIIANSSFSWWGAWLAKESSGRKIAPRNWFNDPAINDSDLIPNNWVRL